MDFARKQLEKYGWTDGKGLGKHEDGISEALKPKLKRSVTGVGYDAAKDFTEHWWSELYNKAASNVQVEEKNGITKNIKPIDSDFEITNNTWRLKKGKKGNSHSEEEYSDFFIKRDVLDNDGAKGDKVKLASSDGNSDDDNDEKIVKMSDEELFKACGGRTAHKGARHGLRALGKLARIEQQEQMLLHESRFQGYFHAKKIKNDRIESKIEDKSNSDQEINQKKKTKKLYNSSSENVNVDAIDDQSLNEIEANQENIAVEKKATTKRKNKNNELQTLEKCPLNSETDNGPIKEKKRKNKKEVVYTDHIKSVANDENNTKKSKRKRKCDNNCEVNEEINDVVVEKEKNVKFNCGEVNDLKVSLQIDESLTNKIVKKKKKKSDKSL